MHAQKSKFLLGKTKPQNKASPLLLKLLSLVLGTMISEFSGEERAIPWDQTHPHCTSGCISAAKKADATRVC